MLLTIIEIAKLVTLSNYYGPRVFPTRVGGETMDVYLDIETTGLSPIMDRVTVVGIGFEHRRSIVQLVGDEITPSNLMKALGRSRRLFTFNGTRFDLPFLKVHLELDLEQHFLHHDLLWDCRACGLTGGLKSIERQLGIHRHHPEVDGLQAVRLWREYERKGDRRSLELLLAYNQEDVRNLKTLRHLLAKLFSR